MFPADLLGDSSSLEETLCKSEWSDMTKSKGLLACGIC